MKTFADTCIPQDAAQLISNSAFIFILTLILTRPYKLISVLLCHTAAEHQSRRLTVPLTFRKKGCVSFHVDRQEKCEISIKDAIRMSKRKKGGLNVTGLMGMQHFSSAATTGELMASDTTCLVPICPLNLCSFKCIHFELQPQSPPCTSSSG